MTIQSRITAICFICIALSAPVMADCLDKNANTNMLPSTPTSRFTLQSDIVVQRPTRLSWMRCAIGQTWDGDSCTGSPDLLNWQDALARAAIEELGGHSDWRLPDRNELQSIVETRCWSPAINVTVFPATPTQPFWSSTARVSPTPGQVWQVDFDNGAVAPADHDLTAAVRLVRGDN